MDVVSELTLGEACRKVLNASEPRAKLMAARAAARDWRLGRLAHVFDCPSPDRPARPAFPELLPAVAMPRRGKAGSARGRLALLHALAHIEFVAIDLAFDLVLRFGAGLPRAFVDDWLKVGADEAMHFALLARRLESLGSHYGALPAHDGLWDAALVTAHDLTARLAIVPMVLEARALDVTPQTIERLLAAGDIASGRLLERIMTDEINHVQAGTKWFQWAANRLGANPVKHWQMLVNLYFRGSVKPPFNDSARGQAGLTRDFYAPLAH
jgi:uncharacterized ferritin-like protein (DUF455 family)